MEAFAQFHSWRFFIDATSNVSLNFPSIFFFLFFISSSFFFISFHFFLPVSFSPLDIFFLVFPFLSNHFSFHLIFFLSFILFISLAIVSLSFSRLSPSFFFSLPTFSLNLSPYLENSLALIFCSFWCQLNKYQGTNTFQVILEFSQNSNPHSKQLLFLFCNNNKCFLLTSRMTNILSIKITYKNTHTKKIAILIQ